MQFGVPEHVVSRVGLGDHLTELRGGSGQIAPHQLCHTETPATDRESNRSPIASARSRPSSAAARAAIGSPAMTAPNACQPRIWLSLHGRLVRGPGRSPRRSTAGPPRGCRRRCRRRRSAPGPAGRGRRLPARSPGLVRPAPCCRWRQPMRRARPCRRAPARAPPAPHRLWCVLWSVRAASNQPSPSRMRPRASHSGCSDDASANASSISEFSRLHANAARRLSISVSACSSRCS